MRMDIDDDHTLQNQVREELNDVELPTANGFVLHPPGYYNGQLVDTTALTTKEQPPDDDETTFGGSDSADPSNNINIPGNDDGDDDDDDDDLELEVPFPMQRPLTLDGYGFGN